MGGKRDINKSRGEGYNKNIHVWKYHIETLYFIKLIGTNKIHIKIIPFDSFKFLYEYHAKIFLIYCFKYSQLHLLLFISIFKIVTKNFKFVAHTIFPLDCSALDKVWVQNLSSSHPILKF